MLSEESRPAVNGCLESLQLCFPSDSTGVIERIALPCKVEASQPQQKCMQGSAVRRQVQHPV